MLSKTASLMNTFPGNLALARAFSNSSKEQISEGPKLPSGLIGAFSISLSLASKSRTIKAISSNKLKNRIVIDTQGIWQLI